MKFVTIFAGLLIGFSAQADCLGKAIMTAKENSRVSRLESVQVLETQPYMEAYIINLVSGQFGNQDRESITVAVMKSDCSVVSVSPKLGP